MLILYAYIIFSLLLIAARFVDETASEIGILWKVLSLILLIAFMPMMAIMNIFLGKVYQDDV